VRKKIAIDIESAVKYADEKVMGGKRSWNLLEEE